MNFVLLLMLVSLVQANDDFSKEVVKSTALTSSVYMIEGAGGNITASIGKDGVLLVDDDFDGMSEKLLVKLKELNGDRPRMVINTHFHYDHTGSNRNFTSATIIAAQEVRDRLSAEQVLWKKKHPAVLDGLPNLTFQDRIKIFVNGDEVQAIHLKSGHTDGDTVVVFSNSKVASLGDLYFSGMYPIFHPEHQGSLRRYLENIEKALKLIPDDAFVVPGHGPLSNRKELANYTEMIRDSVKTVKDGMKSGLSLEGIVKRGLDPKWLGYSHGYRTTEQWLTSVFESCHKGDCP